MMINKTIKWFYAQMKIVYDEQYKMGESFSNWRKLKTSRLFEIILIKVAELGDMLIDNKTYSKYDRINKLTQISLRCMMLTDKLRDKKE